MISEGPGFVVRHISGRFFNSDCYYPGFAKGCYDPSVQMAIIYRLVESPFDADVVANRLACGKWLSAAEWVSVSDQFEVVAGPGCICCGERWGFMFAAPDTSYRCEKHKERNPCAIEGCKRTKGAPALGNGKPYLANDQWICSEHWRRYVPPRSKLRRHYHLIFRRSKREGWTKELERRFWRYWRFLVAQARRKDTEGDLNITEIEKMFGL